MSVTRLSTSWLGYDLDTNDLWFWDGARFRPLVEAAGYATTGALASVQATLQSEIDGKLSAAPTLLGINTTADATNRLALKSNAALFSHDDVTPGTGDMRIAVNKSAAAKDAAFVFEDAFSARALFGLLADDNFTIKVSSDGSTFKTGLTIDKTTGAVDHTQGPKFSAYLNFGQNYAAGSWQDLLFNNFRHNDQSAAAIASNVMTFTAPSAGYYLFGIGATYETTGGSAPTKMQVGLSINGATPSSDTLGTAGDAAITDQKTHVDTTALLKLAAADTVKAKILFVTNDGRVLANENHFWGARIS